MIMTAKYLILIIIIKEMRVVIYKFKDCKAFLDPVHGYINIPRMFIKNIIDDVAFQRLRNIEQTGMRVLYPNAKHDRFSHF